MFSVGSIGAIGRGGARSLDALWRLAGFTPSFDFPFARSRSLVDVVTGQSLIAYTQASSGTYVNSDRVITTAASNEPRFDHDPATGESLGLLEEGQRVNSTRNNTMAGAAAGVPGVLPLNWAVSNTAGLASSVSSVSTENGINYIDLRIAGSPTGQYVLLFDNVISAIATIGQRWSNSLYIKTVGGTQANILSYASRLRFGLETGGLTELFDTSIQPAASNTALIDSRVGAARTTANASTARATSGLVINFVSNGVAVDITLRIGMPQLELAGQSADITSVIPTSAEAVTRSASLADLISSAIANNIRSFYCEFRSPAIGISGVVSLNDNTANNRAAVITSGTDPRLVVHSGGVEQANVNGGTVTAGARTRVAVRINNNDFSISINGGAVVTDTSGALPTVDRIMIGRTQAGEFLNSRIARFTGWNQLLSDATLRSLSSQ